MSYAFEMTSLSSKGQVVIPQDIRNSLHLVSGSKFVVIADEEGIYLKPVKLPDRQQLLKLIEKTQKFAAESGITEDDIAKTIKEERSKLRTSRENRN